MARFSHPQAHEQSCTAVAAMVALAELGLIASSRVGSGLEMQIHGMLKRDPTPGSGQEEILPHAAVGYLTNMGAQASVYQDKARTAPLKAAAATDYAQFKGGLQGAGIGRTFMAIDLNTIFNGGARVFLIVGFFVASGALKAHTILMREDGGSIWVMNPDGGTDSQYNQGQVQTFLTAPPPPMNFANRNYIYTGIAIRIWK